MVIGNLEASERSVKQWDLAGVWLVRRTAFIVAAMAALSGCMFGDEPKDAQPIVGPWFNDNCVPAECLYECCDGWNYYEDPQFQGGASSETVCKEIPKKNEAYAEYATSMLQLWNKCSPEFRDLESGYCHVIEPPDAIKEFRPDGQPVYSGLTFMVCPPRGQPAAYSVEDVELISKE